MSELTGDPRVRRTLQSARLTLFSPLSERRHDDILVADIVERAGVARSTFYVHFDGKDDAVVRCMQFLLEILARSVDKADNESALRGALEHFWGNRRLARPLSLGRPRARIARTLAELIAIRVPAMPGTPRIAPRLMAMQVSEGMLALLVGWLMGAAPASAEAMTSMIRDSAQATVRLIFDRAGDAPR